MAGERSFSHLHTHTEYSMLDGAARVHELVAAAVADGQPALGITDHGNMYGVLDFYKACRDAGVNPIIGTEAYMAGESRFDRPVRRGKVDDTGGDTEGGGKLYYHLTLLAETTQGYRNLMKLSSAAYLEGYYYKPRVDWELLERHHDGVIATTGCLGGVVLQALLAGDEARATKLAARLQDIFGSGNLFVELQDHGLAEQRRTNPALVRIARSIGAPLLATNDSHYTHRKDAEAHSALLCVQTGATIDDPNRFKFDSDEHYLKSAAEMRSLFSELPEACDSTLEIAERANVEIQFGVAQLPEFPVPERFKGATHEERSDVYLRHLTFEGAVRRYGSPVPDEVTKRLEYELGVISSMGFSAYFLVVGDLIDYARKSGIRVGPGRGSAAGCCVAYCLAIVDLDPIRYDLLFERFLNPGRKQMPDIDMDFDERYRSEMIRYAAERYGIRPRCPGGHLLDDQGPCGRARRCKGPRIPVRGRGQDREGDAAARHGPRHPVARVPRQDRGPRGRVRRCSRSARNVRPRPRGSPCHRRRQGPREPEAPGRDPRGSGGHHPRPADRVPPGAAKAGKRAEPTKLRSSPSTRCTASKSSACSRWTSSV